MTDAVTRIVMGSRMLSVVEAALDACLLPIEAGLVGFPRVDVDAEDARRLGQGQRLRGQPPSDGPVAVHGPDGRVLGLATVDPAGVLAPQRLFTWTAQAAIPAAGSQ